MKARHITTCKHLLTAAGRAEERKALAVAARIEQETLSKLVQQADLARVKGIGVVFGLMLGELGVPDVASLARQDPARLHHRLRGYNREERLTRRAPTPEEVSDWVAQARSLPKLVSYRLGATTLEQAELAAE